MGFGAGGGFDVSWEGVRLTKSGVAAVKYNVYLRENAIVLQFCSSDRGRVELAGCLLRLAGVTAEVKKEGNRDVWYIIASTDRLAAGREELRNALAEIVKTARDNGWVDEKTAERWLDKLESGRLLKEGWPKYLVRLARSGALIVRFASTNPGAIERGAHLLREVGLEEGVHFTVKKPEGGKAWYVLIHREGLAYAAWLSAHCSGR